MSSANFLTLLIGSSVRPTISSLDLSILLRRSTRCGIDARQGGHQVAQNSTMTTFPLSFSRVTPSELSQALALISLGFLSFSWACREGATRARTRATDR